MAVSSVSRKARRLGRWVFGLLLIAVVAGAAFWWQTRPTTATTYLTQPADRGAVARTISATGTVNPVLTVTVGSYVSGVIEQVLCDFNDSVTQGQVCARIDDRAYRSAVAQAHANLDLARAQLAKDQAGLEYAKASYDRNVQMVKSNTVSRDAADLAKSTYDQAQAQIQVDQATIEQRQAALDAANIDLDYTQIKSPVAGTVILRNVTAGQTVAASLQTPTLFLIAQDLRRMQVDVNVSESDIGQVKPGEAATFTVNAYPGRTFTGKVTQVRQSPQSVQNVITYDVTVAVANADLALKPGMTAAAHIVVDSRTDVLRVPSKALRYQPSAAARASAGTGGTNAGQGRIWVLRDDKPVPVSVRIGLDDGIWAEITGGQLAAGDKVILGEGSGAARRSGSRTSSPAGGFGFRA
ncbi:efflux RND transporter periplasmic adaptor subunit [Solirhodobacter olei]|uniref:efflux RND transporter periplasmic adaptor subunit n=1 Tax=Solirhodobacter olei TaxID=2493082 RepID=UPI0019D47C37|nr:efflux RND transporter periplasmic adaptor subunit [Solirhodobacter olei]